MDRFRTNAGAPPRQEPARPLAEFLKPTVIDVQGNEEFLDRIAAIFAEQVLAARAEDRQRRDDPARE